MRTRATRPPEFRLLIATSRYRNPYTFLEKGAMLEAGTQLGPYQIITALGAGGTGEVYPARDSRLDRQVAIKVLPEHLAQDPEALARFEREAKAVAAL